ncbi:hypothetical protein BJX99DRAFT_251161 [Aspergillus californicus]
MAPSKHYDAGVQYVSADAPLDDIIYLLKRDGGLVVRGMVSQEDLDTTHNDIKDRLDKDEEWDGEFFPKETRRAPSLIALSPTFVRTQMMHPLFQSICAHFLTTRNSFWWGDKLKESISKPCITSAVALEIGPGGKAQPLHRDSYIHHRVVPHVEEWDDERDVDREVAIGMMVAGCDVTKENGGTQFIPGSHLWATKSKTPPDVNDAVTPQVNRGDAFIMFSSVFHGGGNNTTDQRRLAYACFAVRGYLRQEENQYLAVPREIVKQYDRATQEFIGYYISEPACGFVEELDPYYVLFPEKLKGVKMVDF